VYRFQSFHSELLLVYVAVATVACGDNKDNGAVQDIAVAKDSGFQEDSASIKDDALPPDSTSRKDISGAKDAAMLKESGLIKDKALGKDTVAAKDTSVCDKSYDGSYTSSTFSISATEKLGSTIINQMICNGSLTITVKCSMQPTVQGNYTCTYTGGLVAFDKQQTGVLTGQLGSNGNFSGSITHTFESFLKKSFSYSASIKAGKISGSGNGSFYPHPSSAVPWEVQILF
jgi:hypothetical protein